MILLTDEEIRPFVQCLQEEAVVDIDGLLKAQLKKDTKRFYGYIRYSKPIFGYVGDMGECATVIAHIPVEEYEALLEEVKDDTRT